MAINLAVGKLLGHGPDVTTVSAETRSEVLIEGTKDLELHNAIDLLATLHRATAQPVLPRLFPAFLLLSATIFNL
ncbi:hypothetical protein HGM15179_002678 [Zosterops borbonicus]|uniref:Uncharacterized protein n=1 Tax=Zosterops borbonicus TaxID=364589 RepID=A0A8K1GSH0_9PASS|nr:hypothetical protein HGM15179_002678 [Zosterops borbonicus]